MNESQVTEQELGDISHEDMMSALFAHMVVQQANLAMMLLGKVPHPQTGQTVHDLEGARLFIDQLEMLEAKTKGNLTKEEEHLLKQNLMALRLAFVEAVKSPVPSTPPSEAKPPATEEKAAPGAEPAAADSESKKKFSKKY
jgi:Domain of unknown function (DUF1844)